MTDHFRKLLDILSVPSDPIDVDEEYWNFHERSLKINLPDDYVEFSKRYGSGFLDMKSTTMEIASLFRPTFPLWVLGACRSLDIYRGSLEIEDVPFGIFPETMGLFPFAATSDGDTIGWITEGTPNEWRVVDLSLYEEGQYEIFDVNFTEFIHGVITREIIPNRYETAEPWDVADVTYESEFKLDYRYAKPVN